MRERIRVLRQDKLAGFSVEVPETYIDNSVTVNKNRLVKERSKDVSAPELYQGTSQLSHNFCCHSSAKDA